MFQVNRPFEAAYAGMGTYCKVPLALEPKDLEGADVAIVGAPFDEGVSYRPGARFGPRAIRQADNFLWSPPSRPHMGLGVDPFAELTVVDYGDAECPPADLAASHREIKARVAEILKAGAIPVVLGGDHSLAYPDVTAVAEHFGKGQVGVIQFDTHTDTAPTEWGGELSHGTPMRRLIDEGHVAGEHFIQIGIHGYFPDPADFEWASENGMRWHTRYEIQERGMKAVMDDVIAAARDFPPAVFVTFDIDVFDDLHAPGTGSLEPGGLTPREVFPALNRIFAELPVVGMDLVEVAPTYDPSGNTALLAHRCVLESISALALRRRG
ncbi:MAG: agmatinase [Solirubrobacterales bacterium]|nr:agmatinase [Solirubrobacterales bacterium]